LILLLWVDAFVGGRFCGWTLLWVDAFGDKLQ
jgi:hypothetical protein